MINSKEIGKYITEGLNTASARYSLFNSLYHPEQVKPQLDWKIPGD